MTLPDAKNAAREIAGADMHVVSYRNVWGFFGSSDRELQAVFITKDNASTERSGIFLDKGEEGRFTEYATGKSVPANAVFGKAFFDEDPALFAECGPASAPAVDRIGSLLHESKKRLTAHGLPAGALVMLYDIANCEDDEAAALLRLTVLRNYLIRTEKRISAEEFSYMCQELLGI